MRFFWPISYLFLANLKRTYIGNFLAVDEVFGELSPEDEKHIDIWSPDFRYSLVPVEHSTSGDIIFFAYYDSDTILIQHHFECNATLLDGVNPKEYDFGNNYSPFGTYKHNNKTFEYVCGKVSEVPNNSGNSNEENETYRSDLYGYSFKATDFNVTKGNCSIYSQPNCLEVWNIGSNGENASNLSLNMVLVKGIEKIAIRGQTVSTYYDKENKVWKYWQGASPSPLIRDVPTRKYGSNDVVYTTAGGSQGTSSYFVILNFEEDIAMIIDTGAIMCSPETYCPPSTDFAIVFPAEAKKYEEIKTVLESFSWQETKAETMSVGEAEGLLMKVPDINDYIQEDTMNRSLDCCQLSDDGKYWVARTIQLVVSEGSVGHLATHDWYYVNIENGEISNE